MYPQNVQSAFGDDTLTVQFNEGDVLLGVKMNAWNVQETGGGIDQLDARITDGGVEPGVASIPLWDASEPAFEGRSQQLTNVYQPMHLVMGQDELIYFDRSGGQGTNFATEVYWVASTTEQPMETTNSIITFWGGIVLMLVMAGFIIRYFKDTK